MRAMRTIGVLPIISAGFEAISIRFMGIGPRYPLSRLPPENATGPHEGGPVSRLLTGLLLLTRGASVHDGLLAVHELELALVVPLALARLRGSDQIALLAALLHGLDRRAGLDRDDRGVRRVRQRLDRVDPEVQLVAEVALVDLRDRAHDDERRADVGKREHVDRVLAALLLPVEQRQLGADLVEDRLRRAHADARADLGL